MDFFQPIQLTVLTQLILLILLTLPIQQTVLILRNLPNLQTRAIQANQAIRVNQQILQVPQPCLPSSPSASG